MERKRSRGIRCIFTVAFLLFPADGSNPAIINIYLPKITYQKLLWKYDEICYFDFFPWSSSLYLPIRRIKTVAGTRSGVTACWPHIWTGAQSRGWTQGCPPHLYICLQVSHTLLLILDITKSSSIIKILFAGTNSCSPSSHQTPFPTTLREKNKKNMWEGKKWIK